MTEEHRISIECVDPKPDGTPQCRWRCTCGEVGVPVGSPVYPAGQWAENAGWYHVAMQNAEAA